MQSEQADKQDDHIHTDRPVCHTVKVRLVVSNTSCSALPLDRN
jgi:hypothetical protein